MLSESTLLIADACQGATVFLSLFAYFPQWQELCKTKSSHNISISSWSIWLFSAILSFTYAFVSYFTLKHGVILLISSSANLSFIVITLLMLLHFRNSNLEISMRT